MADLYPFSSGRIIDITIPAFPDACSIFSFPHRLGFLRILEGAIFFVVYYEPSPVHPPDPPSFLFLGSRVGIRGLELFKRRMDDFEAQPADRRYENRRDPGYPVRPARRQEGYPGFEDVRRLGHDGRLQYALV